MLPTNLIQDALQLTGKTMEDMNISVFLGDSIVNGMAFPEFGDNFSIEKFAYYLLSPEFIEKYEDLDGVKWGRFYCSSEFGKAIYEYQKNNHEPIILLLSKIGKK